MAARWSHTEDRAADARWGEEALATTAGVLDRTVNAVRLRYRTRGLSGRATSGRQTFQGLARDTGYNWRDIARAVSDLGIRPVRTCRTPRGRWNLLSDDQVERVIKHLGEETRRDAEMWVPVEELARMAGCCRRTVYYRVGSAVRRGRVPREQVEQLLVVLCRR